MPAVEPGYLRPLIPENPPAEPEEWAQIQKRYPWLNPSPQSLDGPGRLPLPLPRFQRIGSLAGTAVASNAALVLREFPSGLQLDRCWVYVLPSSSAGRPYPERVIAQGMLDARVGEDGFRLLGARSGDTVVLGNGTYNKQLMNTTHLSPRRFP